MDRRRFHEIVDDSEWNPWGEEFEEEGAVQRHHAAPQILWGPVERPLGKRSPLVSADNSSSEDYVVEVWGKAAIASDNPDRRTSQQQQRYKSSAAGGGASGGGQGSQHQQRKTWRNGEWQLVPPHRRQSGTGLDLGAGSSTGSGTGTGAAHDSAWQRNGREDDQWFQNNPYYTLAELPADDWHEDQDDPSLRPVSDDDDDRMSVGTPSLSLPVRPGAVVTTRS
nr:hypothetical protein BaRGS_018915 [Batillaria attramentaria]